MERVGGDGGSRGGRGQRGRGRRGRGGGGVTGGRHYRQQLMPGNEVGYHRRVGADVTDAYGRWREFDRREPFRRNATSTTSTTTAAAAVSQSPQLLYGTLPAPVPVLVPAAFRYPQIIDDDLVPVKRPDKGGVLYVRTTKLKVNHFPVTFNPGNVVRHYDIDVKQEMFFKNSRVGKISKAKLTLIRDRLFADHSSQFPPQGNTAYDGERNIFSAVELPTGKFTVELSEGEGKRICRYIVAVKLVNVLELRKLKEYLSGSLALIPREVLQVMDVVMKENATREMISVGRSFHKRQKNEDNDNGGDDNLGCGIMASRGFQHSLKPTIQGLALCLDYSVLPIHKKLAVVEFLKQHIAYFDVNNFRKYKKNVEEALKGLKVTVTHRVTKQNYTISGLTKDNTRHLTFPVEDPDGNSSSKQVKIVDYFREKYKREILYKDIPCLDLGKGDKKNYVPMEFCVLVEGQMYPKENLDKNAARKLKNMSLATPKDRKKTISDMVHSNDGPYCHGVIQNFDIVVDTNMTSVVGRVIGPPDLKLSGYNGTTLKVAVDREKCQWNLVGKAVVEGKAIERWAVLDLTSSDNRWNCKNFMESLTKKCEKLGIPMKKPLICEESGMNVLCNVGMLHQLLVNLNDQALKIYKGKLQILLCIMSRKHPGYKYLKWISETKVGVVTQCCLSTSKINDQYLSNLALKINAKLGGSNVELIDQPPCFDGEDHVMFVGADVNHPAAGNKTSPSIAAVVATMNWPAANRYAARVRPQCHRQEKIQNFGDMCLDLVETYARLNKVRPGKVLVFRDGVSEGQYDMVLNEELKDLKRALQSINYAPTVTVIIARKRHQTRLFCVDGDYVGNVSPGTVVDTKIVHPFEFDFYLCSHYGSLGTSKPTHYQVLWDEHGFASDQLEKLIYNMCFTFARCTKPVSLVPPVYYADLVAYRGRLYHEAVEGQSPSSASSSSSITSSTLSSATSLDDRFFKLHADLENIMFFV
ncbi:hypothetical protein K2173_003599 [Erythroxylum novogranatense]|uniref:Argonaute 2 n=1 Tax=Erythroxylum novogranatense TaxID=1862640 RepID=A0AAV8TAU7_9ROSI|nr:hypothetical protein K2173_003599 [Erythroxylum novogranatense]